MNCTFSPCSFPLALTRINLTIIFTSKTQSPDDRVFCSKECVMAHYEELEEG